MFSIQQQHVLILFTLSIQCARRVFRLATIKNKIVVVIRYHVQFVDSRKTHRHYLHFNIELPNQVNLIFSLRPHMEKHRIQLRFMYQMRNYSFSTLLVIRLISKQIMINIILFIYSVSLDSSIRRFDNFFIYSNGKLPL